MNGWGWSQYNWPPPPSPTGQGAEPEFWETLAGQWGSPETFLSQPLWDAISQYPIRPDWLPQMMGMPYKREPYPGSWAAYDPSGNMLYLPEDIDPYSTVHEYAHALQPPEWEDAYRRLAWAAPWDLPEGLDWGPPMQESYAEIPRQHLGGARPVPDYLRQYYPWINW